MLRRSKIDLLRYLKKSFPPELLVPININTARTIQLESRFSLKRPEAAAILKYRKDHGDLKPIEDLKKVERWRARKTASLLTVSWGG